MRICSLAAISTESARSNAGVLAANFIGAEVNPDPSKSKETTMSSPRGAERKGTAASRPEARVSRAVLPARYKVCLVTLRA